jgi:hypothetical protein
MNNCTHFWEYLKRKSLKFIEAKNVLNKILKWNPLYSQYNFPFSLTLFEIIKPSNFSVPLLCTTGYSMQKLYVLPTQSLLCVLYAPHNTQRLFRCKILSVWFLCLKRNVFTTLYERNLYTNGVRKATVKSPVPSWLCSDVCHDKLRRGGLRSITTGSTDNM